MGDHAHGGRSRRDDGRGLVAALRREARAERPPFSAALHDGVLAAVAVESARRPSRPAGRPARFRAALGGLAAAVACAVVAIGGFWRREAPRPGNAAPVAAVADMPGIERLPTPAEIGAGVLAEVTTLAADAVGLRELTGLASLDPAMFGPADDTGP